MNDFLNKWYYYPWAPSLHDSHLLHPENRNIEGFSLVKCIGIEDSYLLLKNKDLIIRALPIGIKIELPFPKFEWYNKVMEKEAQHRKGEIFELFWHFKRECYCYYISVDEKRRDRRYVEDELVSIAE